MKWSIDRSGAVQLVGTFGILACIAVLSCVSLLRYRDTRQQIEQTQTVLYQLEAVLSTLKDAETGQRGYLLTGQQVYLEPFQLALSQYEQQLAQLTDLTRDNPKQQQALAILQPLIAEKLAFVEQTITLCERQGFTSALDAIETDRGRRLMDQIRALGLAMEAEESRLLIEQTRQSDRAAIQTTFTVVAGVFLAALFSASGAASFYRIRQRLTTSLQQSEETRQMSEDRFTLAVEAAQLGTWDWDLETGVIIWSVQCEELFGLEPGSFAGTYEAFVQLVHPDDAEPLRRSLQTAMADAGVGTDTWKRDFRIIHAKGTIRWITSTGKLIYSKHGKAVRAIGVFEDSTDRQQVQEILSQANASLKAKVDEQTTELTQSNHSLQSELAARILAEQQLQNLTQEQQVIAERTTALEQIQLLQTLAAIIAEAQNLDTAFAHVLATVGTFQNWSYGEVWLPDSQEQVLQCQTAWCDQPQATNSPLSRLKTFTFPAGVGLPGRVWASQQPEWRTDVSIEPETVFPRCHIALESGIKAGVGVPLILNDRVLAVLVFFKLEAASENLQQMQSLWTIAAQLSLVIGRKQAEEALTKELLRSKAFFKASFDGVVVINQQGNVVETSPSFAQMLGYSLEEAANLHVSDWDAQWSRAELVQMLQESKLTGAPFETLHRRKDGSVYEVEISISNIVLENEVILICICRDISERKRIEAERQRNEVALRQSEEQLQLALEGSGDGLWDWDLTTGCVYVSPRWLGMLGYEVGDLLVDASTWQSLIHPDDQPETMKTLADHLSDDSHPYSFDYRLRTKSGEWKWIGNHGKVVVRDQQGTPLRMTGTHKDISDRKNAENELQTLMAKLQQSNQELQTFAYVASHDLKEPLRTVRNFCSLLQVKCGASLNDRGQDYIDRIQKATQRMQALIDDLLLLSRVTTEAKPFVPVDLTNLVSEVVAALEMQIQRTGGVVEIGALPTVNGDAIQLSQLFQNLISNALKFHRDIPPVVRVSSHVTSPAPTSSNQEPSYQILVEDNGIGFEEQYRDRIFGTFERLHGRMEFEGTGIGLAICRKITERHGGTIVAHSTPGQGSTFIITLPLL
jgi:PAS domain S-box-containing protein